MIISALWAFFIALKFSIILVDLAFASLNRTSLLLYVQSEWFLREFRWILINVKGSIQATKGLIIVRAF